VINLRILALITARGGSKRLPGKNIRSLGGRPLIAWSVEVVQGVPSICDILVSTDDRDIANIAADMGALVPWLRPAELATDSASSVDVSLHAIDWYESYSSKVDGLLLLQPTSPFRSRITLERGITLFSANRYRPVVGVSPAKSHPMRCFKVEGETMVSFLDGGEGLRSQDLPPAYEVNGAFYLIAPEDLRNARSFYCCNMVPLVIDQPEESIDIDTEWDWKIAEAVEAARRIAGE
jgi:CMP-N,N'-diacetyllegionaminic acid synthase